jgi:fructosamine-3-kinase
MPEQPTPIKLTDDALRLPLEGFISGYLKRPWSVKTSTDLIDFACHPASLLSDGSFSVFAKFSDAPNGSEQFEIELASLRLLTEKSGVLTPLPVGILPVEGGCLLVLEDVHRVERKPPHWRQIGQALGRIHQVKSKRFGFERHGYFGPLRQDNTPTDDWVAFYTERRLIPGLKMAHDSGNLPHYLVKPLECIIAALPDICGPRVIPSLLHGDAQQNNYITSEAGPYVIDPAIHYGHPEMDLAWLDAFQPVPEAVFEGYLEEQPIDPGFWERRPLWRLWGYLAAVTVEGSNYHGKLIESVKICASW